MGLLDALSAGIGAAAPAGAALAQGQAQATQSNTGFLEKLAAMQQAKQKADMDRQLQTAQIGDIQAQQAQRQAQADAQARRFSPDSINAAAKTWGVDSATAEMMLRDPLTLNYILEKKKTVPQLKVTPGEAIQRPDGTWYVPVAKQDVAAKYAPVTVTGPDGKPIVGRFNNLTGQIEDTGFGKPAAAGKAGGGMGGALANRQKDYIGLMDQGIGDMESLSSKIDPYLITAAIKSPMLANPLLGDNEQQYLASARNFLAGVLHEESGARLSDAQLAFGVQRYFPIGGDSPKVIATKLANAKTTLAERKRNANYVPPGAPLSPQAQTEISTSESAAPSAPPAAGNASQFGAYGQFVPRKTP